MRAGGSEPGVVEVCSERGGMKASRSDKMCVNERETSGKANTHTSEGKKRVQPGWSD